MMRKTIILFFLAALSSGLHAQWQWTQGPDGGRVLGLFADNTVLLASTDSGIFRTLVQSNAWSRSSLSDSDSFIPWSGSGFVGMGPYLFAGGFMTGVYRSSDHGIHWASVGGPYNITGMGVIGSRLFVSSSFLSVNVSTDSGETWALDSPGGSQNGGNPNRIYSLETVSTTVFISGAGGSRHSTDSGMTWSGVHEDRGFNNYGGVGSIIFGCDTDSVYLSSDKGNTWIVAISNSLPNRSINCFAVSGTEIFVGGAHGIFSSRDSGRYWVAQNRGIPIDTVSQLAVGAGYLFAGFLHNGVWRRSLSEFGMSGVKNRSRTNLNIVVSPNPTTGIITIQNAPEDILYVTITNSLGENVIDLRHPNAPEFTVDLSKLPPGAYQARFSLPNEVISRMIIRQ